MQKKDEVWQTVELSQKYLKGVREAIPLANEQITVMLRLIQHACPGVTTVLDLGCGDGILGQAILDRFPAARVSFLDFSQPMLDAAGKRLQNYVRAHFVQADYGRLDWQKSLGSRDKAAEHSSSNGQDGSNYDFPFGPPFDVIVSGYSIHHQTDDRKRELYAELYDLLKPGGIFINVEHVASLTPWGETVFADHFIDALVEFHQQQGTPKSREQVDQEYYSRPDKAANVLTPVETQCEWLREIGFQDVDCYLKIFELAVFGGTKPK